MINKTNKELFDKEILELEKLQGKERGADIKFLINYVKDKEGADGLKEIKKELAENYSFFLPDAEKVNDVEWISESIPHIFMVAAVRFFDWNDAEIYELGKSALSYSRSIKLFVRYFISIEKSIQKTTEHWNDYYTEGKMIFASFDKEHNRATLELREFKTHPIVCVFICGVIAKIVELITGSKESKVREIECVFKGSDHHTFELTW